MKYAMLYDKNDLILPYMLIYINEDSNILKWSSWAPSIQSTCSQSMNTSGSPIPLGGLSRYGPIAEAATIEELQLILMLEN